jgi:hypothetical protein
VMLLTKQIYGLIFSKCSACDVVELQVMLGFPPLVHSIPSHFGFLCVQDFGSTTEAHGSPEAACIGTQDKAKGPLNIKGLSPGLT